MYNQLRLFHYPKIS